MDSETHILITRALNYRYRVKVDIVGINHWFLRSRWVLDRGCP